MEYEFQNAIGKSVGEVVRDVTDFLSCSCVINPERQIDLAQILPDLNMAEQFSFALLSEAQMQGVRTEEAESFYRHAVGSLVPDAIMDRMIAAFRDPSGDDYRLYRAKYGNSFTLLDGSYWSTCLALGIDCERIEDVLQYLRLFTVCLMEYAYMGDRNPTQTYTWTYYESFRAMLDELTAPPEEPPKPIRVRAIGGTAGKRTEEGYALSLGVDLENPNPDRLARAIRLDITLKDREGNTVAVIKDQIHCMDPSAIYHYGITRKIKGAAVASISASAKAGGYLKLSTPIMKHITLSNLRLGKDEEQTHLTGKMDSKYDTPISTFTLHYQFLSADNKILGGGNEWIPQGIDGHGSCDFSTTLPLTVKNTAKAVYSIDFDAVELIK